MVNRSNFPNSVDTFQVMVEVLASDKTNVERYQQLVMQAVRTPEEETELANLKTTLGNKIISSDHFNFLQDSIVNMQDYYLNEVVAHLETLDVGALRADLGDLAFLNTEDKTNLVSAVSEVNYIKADASISQLKKVTADNGDVLISISETTGDILSEIVNRGRGYSTFYAVTGSKNLPPDGISIRGMSHLTNPDIGWVIAIDYRNQVYVNYLSGASGWLGWNKIVTDAKPTWVSASLQNGWINYGGSDPTAQFCKIGSKVTIKGTIKNGNTSGGTVLFTLPSGFRPAQRFIHVGTVSGLEFIRMYIETSGVVTISSTVSNNNWLSLDGIEFVADGN